MKDISDGRFYGPDDMVLAGCDDCAGCSKCCHLVGDTIKLDPFDAVSMDFAAGFAGYFHLADILKMAVSDIFCRFTNVTARCVNW